MPPPVPALRWMLFVDGENLTIRGQKVAEERNVELYESGCWKKDQFIWIPGSTATKRYGSLYPLVEDTAFRATYYTSVWGDENETTLRDSLWALGFEPKVFRKTRKQDKSKGVDIALATDMLTHAFRANYDTAVLMTGDGDYLPLLEEVKRLGRRVHIHAFAAGLNPRLREAADGFLDITDQFLDGWRRKLLPAVRPLP